MELSLKDRAACIELDLALTREAANRRQTRYVVSQPLVVDGRDGFASDKHARDGFRDLSCCALAEFAPPPNAMVHEHFQDLFPLGPVISGVGRSQCPYIGHRLDKLACKSADKLASPRGLEPLFSP
jgi:hypothetical protein